MEIVLEVGKTYISRCAGTFKCIYVDSPLAWMLHTRGINGETYGDAHIWHLDGCCYSNAFFSEYSCRIIGEFK